MKINPDSRWAVVRLYYAQIRAMISHLLYYTLAIRPIYPRRSTFRSERKKRGGGEGRRKEEKRMKKEGKEQEGGQREREREKLRARVLFPCSPRAVPRLFFHALFPGFNGWTIKQFEIHRMAHLTHRELHNRICAWKKRSSFSLYDFPPSPPLVYKLPLPPYHDDPLTKLFSTGNDCRSVTK